MTSKQWASVLALTLGLSRAGAQEFDPRLPTSDPLRPVVIASTPFVTRPPAEPARPVLLPPAIQQAALNPAPATPMPIAPALSVPAFTAQADAPLVTLDRPHWIGDDRSSYSTPPGDVTLVRAQAPEGPTTSLAGPPPVPPPAEGLPPIVPADGYNAGVAIDRPLNKNFWDRCGDWFHGGTHSSTAGAHAWGSDHCFDVGGIISPVSNPFFFEDPRALTELRPLFIYEKFPNRVTGGGNAEFYGLQGRLAFNECWSLVVNKLGFVTVNRGNDSPFDGGTGFAELWLGPKYTFLRNEQSGSAAAVGLTFEFPIGGTKVNQDHGTLGLDPYITYGQTFLRSSYGAFNFVSELGYNFSVDNQRANFLHSSMHLDYDIANMHKFYPLIELNWFYFTKNGKANAIAFEGDDLLAFGATNVSGESFTNIAFGSRYKFNENFQMGGYIQFPLTGRDRSTENYRLGFDMIFRY